jgi:hypothetical protein
MEETQLQSSATIAERQLHKLLGHDDLQMGVLKSTAGNIQHPTPNIQLGTLNLEPRTLNPKELDKATRGYPEATLRLSGGQPVATRRLPRGYPGATLRLP